MANLKGNTVPGRTTQGSLGDIYTNENTGKGYKCVFSYKDSTKKTYDTAWVELETKKNTGLKADVKKQGVKPNEATTTNEPVHETTSQTETVDKSEKKNYANYTKNKRK